MVALEKGTPIKTQMPEGIVDRRIEREKLASSLFERWGGMVIDTGIGTLKVEVARRVKVRDKEVDGTIVPVTRLLHLIWCYQDEIVDQERNRKLVAGSDSYSALGAILSLGKKYSVPIMTELDRRMSLFSR